MRHLSVVVIKQVVYTGIKAVCAVKQNDANFVCEVGTISKFSDFQPEGPGFNLRPGRGLNFKRPSFATPSVDRDVKPLV